MTEEEMRIAIAEACGYLRPHYTPSGSCQASAHMKDDGTYWGTKGVPDYPNDLNAMHEAEKVLTDDQDLDYSEALESVVGGRWNCNNSEDMRRLRSATARQRAEAFVETLNLWTK